MPEVSRFFGILIAIYYLDLAGEVFEPEFLREKLPVDAIVGRSRVYYNA